MLGIIVFFQPQSYTQWQVSGERDSCCCCWLIPVNIACLVFSLLNLFFLSTFLFTVDAWAKSGEGGAAATRAEAILQHMNQLYQSGGHDTVKPTTGIFNAVINAWARSREKIAPVRAEQILEWMEKLHRNGNLDIKPDKYTFNTGKHAV